MKKILCDALNTITNVCRKDLATCFSAEDIEIMNKSNLKQMKTFLIRIARGKIDEEDLEDCDMNNKQQNGQEKHPITMKENKISEQHPTTAHPEKQISTHKEEVLIEQQTGESAPAGQMRDNIDQEKLIETDEKQKKAKDKNSAKTTDSPPSEAHKTNNKSSASHLRVIKSVIFGIILLSLQ